MNELVINDEKIENMIYEIRGKQVMLDSDLAKLFCITTGNLNRAMKRNIDRFPETFCFQLSNKEFEILKCQIGISSLEYGGRRFMPYAYTEQGVAMLSAVIHSALAIEMSVKIMDAFVAMRHFILTNQDIYKSITNINNKLIEHDEKLNLLFSKFEIKENLFLPGQVYDSYSEIIRIFNNAQNNLIIIDSYADITLLDMLKNINCKIELITSKKAKLSNLEIEKFNKQYNNKLKVFINDTFHDRYFILDKKQVYHCGTSINHVGSKTFSINILEDDLIKNRLINYVSELI